ncbi:MAG TPA: sigma-70 family RNA polymerase sigma factor [Vicinamibacterales bacterium]|nr:sigma-70 family RNA polymerase sigma factor [Vicinamibacterales bacterium]
MSPPSATITRLLGEWSRGDASALEQLLPIVYAELRRVAGRELRRERADHTLQPTALVNELYLRLVKQRSASWENRAQFFAVAAQLMRRILVDHARAQAAAKRGGASSRVSLSDAEGVEVEPALEVLAVDRALTRLAMLDVEQARIVELRYFSGLTVEETAHVLGTSPRTVKREWRLARAWLYEQLRAGIQT